MVYYSNETLIALVLAGLPAILAIYFYFYKKRTKTALVLLGLSGLLIRFVMISLDPFLQEWDEKFHALVAKNMMDFPLKPMLRKDPIMPFKMDDWSNNHIWLHKQPWFLWQMALSMKLFGVKILALRLPSMVMGVLSIFLTYDIARLWTKNLDIAFLSSLLFTLSFYQLELTSARYYLGQNDITFAFYVTLSIWSFLRYINNKNSYKWVVMIGVFAGIAILNKWLTGFLIFGGWGLYLLIDNSLRYKKKNWFHFFVALIVCFLTFIPWQIYISNHFPFEYVIESLHNREHIYKVFGGHKGSIFFHLEQMAYLYGIFFLIFIPMGIIDQYKRQNISNHLSIPLWAMIIVIYFFFSVVKTKMPAFTFPVNSLIWVIIATGIIKVSSFIIGRFKFKRSHFMIYSFIILGILVLKPWKITSHRSQTNLSRNDKIQKATFYRNISQDLIKGKVVINCKAFEDVDLMFYKDVNAYCWFPTQKRLDSLMRKKYRFIAFKNQPNQNLPAYIINNREIEFIE